MNRRILVAGAGGYLGLAAAVALSRGARVVGTWHRQRPKPFPGVDLVHCAVQDPNSVNSLFDRSGPFDVIVNATVRFEKPTDSSLSDILQTNIAGHSNLLSGAARSGCRRFIYCSSISVYERAGHHDESRPISPVSLYGRTKQLAEQLTQLWAEAQPDMTGVSLRFAGIHGGTRQNGVLYAMIQAALHNEPISVSEPRSRFRLCLIEDAVTAIALAVDVRPQQPFSCFNIASRDQYTLGELAEIVKRITQSRSEIRLGAADAREEAMPIDRFAKLTGFSPTSIEDGIRRLTSDIR